MLQQSSAAAAQPEAERRGGGVGEGVGVRVVSQAERAAHTGDGGWVAGFPPPPLWCVAWVGGGVVPEAKKSKEKLRKVNKAKKSKKSQEKQRKARRNGKS